MALSKSELLAFDRFRAAYPRRPDNPWSRAKPKFEAVLRRGVPADELVRAAAAYAIQCRDLGKDPKFVVYASTFLHQRQYEDFLEADVPASPELQANPEHPLAWMRAVIGEETWVSWISRLSVDLSATPIRIAAPSQFTLDRVRRDFGPLIADRLGDVAWGLQKTDSHAAHL